MARFVYSIFSYFGLILALPFVALKALYDPRYRYRIKDRLGFSPLRGSKKVIWFHAASVGEVLLSLPFLQGVLSQFPEHELFVSTQTPSGHQTVEAKLKGQVQAFLTPVDTPDAVKRAVRRVQPEIYILVETEIWPNLLLHLRDRQIPIILLNGRISEPAFKKYRFFRFFLAPILNSFDYIATRGDYDCKRFMALGVPASKIHIMGNLKYDCKITPCSVEISSLVENYLTDHGVYPLAVLGSLHEGEYDILVRVCSAVRKKIPELKFIWAPRHLESLTEIKRKLKAAGFSFFERSTAPAPLTDGKFRDIMLLDTYGELASIYSLATVVFVGGSLSPDGGQNMIEPAYFKRPVLFGPHLWNFEDISAHLINNKGAYKVLDEDELISKFVELLSNKNIRQTMGENGYAVIKQHQGALQRALQALESVLANKEGK
ncbi:3-deoxy-D-manno-octulosonic acid transferase [candidate division CSSED10-310 bacterium]|uniref:3-deoxy-D-manno-octulosonic acid transferase n=1 Tax=candidate division CSSED10-310 bacterium TaxID=2855610 RepID=A0ABV6YXI1_UNCC1